MILALEGALGPFSAALRSPDGAIERCAATQGGDALERGLEIVAAVLGPAGFGPVRSIAVTVGPGAYTGLRIALSYAKSLALARALPLVALSSFDVVEAAEAELPSAAFIAGKKGFVHVRLRQATETATFSGPLSEAEDWIVAALPGGSSATCFGAAQGTLARLGERGLNVRTLPEETVPAALTLARRAFAHDPLPDAHALRADYGAA
ncbi:MAG: hypothetical protein GIW95_03590 [Candidatus Eremiobacteraeota bacterium]|nr:hypothetical protein [Candidatus Eremiobacteraeota bacterium]